MSRETYEIALFLHAETDAAWLVSQSPVRNDASTTCVWLPKSQCEEVNRSTRASGSTSGISIRLNVPLWLIEKNDMEDLV